jgi:hypothetical protein
MAPPGARAFAGACALASAACALLNVLLMCVAVDFDVERLHAFASLHDVDAAGARWLVWSMVADVGFYALLAPAALLATSSLLTCLAGLAYAALGAAGALALAVLWPGQLARHDVEEFVALTTFVYEVVWNRACAFVGAVWWLSLARAWWRASSPARSHVDRAVVSVSGALGVVSALEGALGVVRHPLAMPVLDALLTLLPIWSVVVGVALLVGARVSARTARGA